MSVDCIFCKIVNGIIPSKKIYEDEDVIASESGIKVDRVIGILELLSKQGKIKDFSLEELPAPPWLDATSGKSDQRQEVAATNSTNRPTRRTSVLLLICVPTSDCAIHDSFPMGLLKKETYEIVSESFQS